MKRFHLSDLIAEKIIRVISLSTLVIPTCRNITHDDEVHKICKYLRSFRIFDEADQNRICNPIALNTADKKATELLTEIGKRGQHAYWFLAHALKSLGTKQIPLFNYFHGEDFHCCGTYGVLLILYVRYVFNVTYKRLKRLKSLHERKLTLDCRSLNELERHYTITYRVARTVTKFYFQFRTHHITVFNPKI